MKIYDCFTFFNEIDLLEFRLKLLNDYVDEFIIVESNYTHSGKPKPFNFLNEKDRFTPWENKIKYIPLEQNIEGLNFNTNEEKYNPSNGSWILENEQRDAIKKYFSNYHDDDIIIVSDLDEMPNPKLIKKINLQDGPRVLQMLFHYYFVNCQCIGNERWWNGTILTKGKDFKHLSPQILRDNRNNYPFIPKAGWHFSYLGGIEKIKYKIQSFAHTEYNKSEFLNDEQLINAIAKGKDIFGRADKKYRVFPLEFYPKFLQKLFLQYPYFTTSTKHISFFEKTFYQLKRFFS